MSKTANKNEEIQCFFFFIMWIVLLQFQKDILLIIKHVKKNSFLTGITVVSGLNILKITVPVAVRQGKSALPEWEGLEQVCSSESCAVQFYRYFLFCLGVHSASNITPCTLASNTSLMLWEELHSWLQSKFETRLGHMRPGLKKLKQNFTSQNSSKLSLPSTQSGSALRPNPHSSNSK